MEGQSAALGANNLLNFGERHNDDGSPTISFFDESVENFFIAIDKISMLCGEPDVLSDGEIKHLSSSVTFLREWRHFKYSDRYVQFACQDENTSQEKDHIITLPQFSAAAVPKREGQTGNTISAQSSEDFVMYVGGPVWALDWCPRIDPGSDCQITCEFIAVASHSPESSYHKIGEPLSGRGIIQIWCLLNDGKGESLHPIKKKSEKHGMQPKRSRGRPRKHNVVIDTSSQPKKSVGRPGKKPVPETIHDPNEDSELFEDLAAEFPESYPDRESVSTKCLDNLLLTDKESGHCDGIPLLAYNEDKESSEPNSNPSFSFGQDAEDALAIRASGFKIPGDVALPRLVLCLAHNGKVAWDAKWRPSSNHHNKLKHRMGYLAVLLGNGALEVWDVLLPQTMKVLYFTCQMKGTDPQIDPRFVKLDPVFRCSKLMHCGRRSIPLTVEWSTSSPHDRILVGCHDGSVAVWNFSPNSHCTDTGPVSIFSADTVPIRALAWAPAESDDDSSNIVLIAGHRGLKFWDLRNPCKPLWDFNPVQRIIYSLDWLRDLRCIVLSFDDGTLRILSLLKAANDVPVTGELFAGTPQQGFHSYYCSSFAIWNVHVSRLTGMVAYCSADGHVLRFQLTTRAVEVDALRNRAPHYLCGSLSEENSVIKIVTPLPGASFPMRKSLNEWSTAPRTIRGFVSVSNQAKRAEDKMKDKEVDSQALAIYYGNDPESQQETKGALGTANRKRTPQSIKTSSKKKVKGHQGSNIDDQTGEEAGGEEAGSFPRKSVAMHRVRWNMNKGSERWLCYGGAAGIVRCQKINI